MRSRSAPRPPARRRGAQESAPGVEGCSVAVRCDGEGERHGEGFALRCRGRRSMLRAARRRAGVEGHRDRSASRPQGRWRGVRARRGGDRVRAGSTAGAPSAGDRAGPDGGPGRDRAAPSARSGERREGRRHDRALRRGARRDRAASRHQVDPRDGQGADGLGRRDRGRRLLRAEARRLHAQRVHLPGPHGRGRLRRQGRVGDGALRRAPRPVPEGRRRREDGGAGRRPRRPADRLARERPPRRLPRDRGHRRHPRPQAPRRPQGRRRRVLVPRPGRVPRDPGGEGVARARGRGGQRDRLRRLRAGRGGLDGVRVGLRRQGPAARLPLQGQADRGQRRHRRRRLPLPAGGGEGGPDHPRRRRRRRRPPRGPSPRPPPGPRPRSTRA